MSTKQTHTAAAQVVSPKGKALTVACSGTERVGELLAQFGCVREGKSVITLKLSVDSEVRQDLIPARRNETDLFAVASDADREILIKAREIKQRLETAAKAHARQRVGNGKRDVWTTQVVAKRG
jgi:hypothetical protein